MLPKAPRIKSQWLLLFISLYLTAFLNIPFFKHIYGYVWELESINYLFVVSLPVFLCCAIYVFLSPFVIKGLTKPLLAMILILSAMASYATLSYGTIFDPSMIQNFVETDAAEASGYLSLSAATNLLIFGIIPAALLLWIKIDYRPFIKEVAYRLLYVAIALTIFAGVTFGLYQDYAGVARNNAQVQKLIVPGEFITSIVRYAANNLFVTNQQFADLGTDAHEIKTATDLPRLTVVVLGETARAANYHFNGYPRDTNPYTSKLNILALHNVTSCGTSTAISVPCMFSFLQHSNFDKSNALYQSNVLDVLTEAGIQVTWIDNSSGCKDVCVRVPTKLTDKTDPGGLCDGEHCYDEVLLSYLDQALATASPDHDQVIVLHLIGSHGPTYYLRYPDQFKTFTPDCPRSDIQNCTQEQIINSYDNTIRYTDYVLSLLVQYLNQDAQYESALVYMSDHGESLGEGGIYLHGMPYSFAPEEQIKVPGLVWLSPKFLADQPMDDQCLNGLANQPLSHDYLSHTLLGLMSVQTSTYNPQLDLFAGCRKSIQGMLTTAHR